MPAELLDFLTQALAVTAVVTALLALTRRGGTLVAGLATAALSAPTLVLLALHEGTVFARLAALGALLTTPVCAVLATLALRALGSTAAPGGPSRRGWAWLSPLLAGLMSAGVCALAHRLGALGSGFVSGLPLVAAWTALGTHTYSGSAATRRYVQAYRYGLGPRAVMYLCFACTAVPWGPAWAMGLALALAALWGAWQRERRGWGPAFTH